jgi:predicted peroxiredoxin
MAKFVLIESRDPFDSADWKDFHELALGLTKAGNEVTVFLTQNGVLPTRRGSTAAADLAELSRSATVLADEFAVRERGIDKGSIVDGVRMTGIDTLVGLLMEDGRRAIWH